MIVPFLNVRKSKGLRGEGMVGRMRMRQAQKGRNRASAVSRLHASGTGTVVPKNFNPAGRTQPTSAFPFMGGLPSTNIGG